MLSDPSKNSAKLKHSKDPSYEVIPEPVLAHMGKGLHSVGGFNVSNLMGITRRKIDIGKKITFYFLLNV
jgi:hypothetical protein